MSMSSKERVRAALEFRRPDHVPCGFYAIDYDAVERLIGHETYVRNKARTRAALWAGRRDEVAQSYIEDSIALFHKLDDVLDLINLFSELYPVLPPRGWRDPDPPRQVDDVTWVDSEGRVYKYSDMTADITMVEDPHKYTREFKPEDFTLEYGPAPEDETIYEAVDAIVQEFGERKYIIGPAPFAREMILLGGFERGLMEMAANPELVERAVESERAAARARQAGWHNRGYEALLTGEDFAYNTGPFMSLPMFRRFCYPLLADNVHFAHAHGLKFIHHACGNNWQLLDSFMEAGIDCYQSVQATAGMDLAQVKATTRGRMAVWGGARLEYLMSGTPEEVRQNVREELEIGAPDGGYIFGTSHSIAVGCKYDNVMAMFDEFVKRR
jgi:uroporphyrinogen-III decarboxylase